MEGEGWPEKGKGMEGHRWKAGGKQPSKLEGQKLRVEGSKTRTYERTDMIMIVGRFDPFLHILLTFNSSFKNGAVDFSTT